MADFLERRAADRRRAEAFWQNWLATAGNWHTLPAAQWLQRVNPLLHKSFPGISFQVVAENPDGQVLQVALSSANKTAPMADAVLLAETAPPLPFTVQALLRRCDPAQLPQRQAVFGGAAVDGARLQVACREDEGGLIKLDVCAGNGLPTDHRGQHVAVWMLLADALGQWDLNVKVGDIELLPQAPEQALTLAQLPAAFDALWRDRLGHNGVYPLGRHEYQVYEGSSGGDLPPPLLVRNESAAALIGRADMAWRVAIRCEAYDELSLAWAAEIEEAFSARVSLDGQGITTTIYTDLVEGECQVSAMVANPDAAATAAQEIAARYVRLNARVEGEFDPSWRHYRL